MAENFHFVTKNCLEWITDSPFLDCPKQSPIFSFLGIDWYLCLDLTADGNGYYFALYVHNVEKKLLTKEAILTVFVTRYDKRSIQLFLTSGIDYLQEEETIIFKKHIGAKEDLHKYYGRLTVLCNFSADLPSELHINGSKAMYQSNLLALEGQHSSTPDSIIMKAKLAASAPDDSLYGVENLSFNFSRLLEQKSFADVTLKCGERKFSAHKVILAARSGVFNAMFQNKMAESETGIIDIIDIDSDVLDLLLKYVYTGKIQDLSVGIATKLYMVADKYSVTSLKYECSKLMLGSLTKENCLDFLLLADACNDKKFKDKLINFVAEIMNLIGEAFLKFTEKNPQLALSVFQRYAFITKKV